MGKGKRLEGIITGEEINHCTKKHFNSRNSQFVWKLLQLFFFFLSEKRRTERIGQNCSHAKDTSMNIRTAYRQVHST